MAHPWGDPIVDPKTRWLGWIPTAAEFLAAWHNADAPARHDLQIAFRFYPYELDTEIDAVLAHIQRQTPEVTAAMRTSLFTADSVLSPQQQRFTSALATHLDITGADKQLAFDSRFCRVLYNDAGFHLDVLISSPLEIPADAELTALLPPALTPQTLLRYRVVQLLRANRGLLEPEPGSQPLPGIDNMGL